MLIRFGFGLIRIGRPTGIGPSFDVSATLCLWPRGDVPKGEYQWHRILRVSWNWLPDRIYQHLISSNKNAFDSSRWTGRDRRFVGFGIWHREIWSHRSTRRSKMYVYLTGSKERTGEHVMYVAPAAVTPKADCPADWFNGDGETPQQFTIKFIDGRASVEQNLGEWMIKNKYAQRTNAIIRQRSGALLGSLADAIAGR